MMSSYNLKTNVIKKALSKALQFCVLMSISGCLFAADQSQNVISNHSVASSTDHILKTLLALISVLALIFALAWVVKNYFGFSPVSNSMVKMVAGISVGQKERVVLLQVGERQMLVGVAPGNVNMLHVLEDGTELKIDSNAKSNFADKFKSSLKKIETKT